MSVPSMDNLLAQAIAKDRSAFIEYFPSLKSENNNEGAARLALQRFLRDSECHCIMQRRVTDALMNSTSLALTIQMRHPGFGTYNIENYPISYGPEDPEGGARIIGIITSGAYDFTLNNIWVKRAVRLLFQHLTSQ